MGETYSYSGMMIRYVEQSQEGRHLSRITGIIVAMDTPFDDAGAVSPDRIRVLLDFLQARGVSGFFLCGGTGLAGVLSPSERKLVARTAANHLKGSLPLLVHVGSPITAEAIGLAEDAVVHGVQGVVLSSPNWFYQHEPEAVYEDFSLICSAVPETPVYLYRRGTDQWTAEMVARLRAECPNVVGIKDSANDINLHLSFLGMKEMSIYQGYEPMTTASVTAGACGVVSGLATIFPEAMVKLYDLLMAGEARRAASQQQLVNRLVAITYRPAAYRRFKAVLRARGCPAGEVRRPFRPMTAGEENDLIQSLRALGVL